MLAGIVLLACGATRAHSQAARIEQTDAVLVGNAGDVIELPTWNGDGDAGGDGQRDGCDHGQRDLDDHGRGDVHGD